MQGVMHIGVICCLLVYSILSNMETPLRNVCIIIRFSFTVNALPRVAITNS